MRWEKDGGREKEMDGIGISISLCFVGFIACSWPAGWRRHEMELVFDWGIDDVPRSMACLAGSSIIGQNQSLST